MKMLLLALCFSLAACGGAIDDPLLDGGSDGSPGNDGAPAKDGSPAVDGSASNCDTLLAELTSEEPAAEQCCATCDSLQCTTQVEGVCCPLTVNSTDSSAVKAYEATLQAFKNASCVANCPALACTTKPTGDCTGNTQSGTCAQF